MKIGQAKTSASEAKKLVDKGLEDVTKILNELSNIVDFGEWTGFYCNVPI